MGAGPHGQKRPHRPFGALPPQAGEGKAARLCGGEKQVLRCAQDDGSGASPRRQKRPHRPFGALPPQAGEGKAARLCGGEKQVLRCAQDDGSGGKPAPPKAPPSPLRGTSPAGGGREKRRYGLPAMPAQAGIPLSGDKVKSWTPAFAGVTGKGACEAMPLLPPPLAGRAGVGAGPHGQKRPHRPFGALPPQAGEGKSSVTVCS